MVNGLLILILGAGSAYEAPSSHMYSHYIFSLYIIYLQSNSLLYSVPTTKIFTYFEVR